MSITRVRATSTVNGATTTIPNSGTGYALAQSFAPGIYSITCVSSTNVTIAFYNGTTLLTTVATVSGSVTAVLGSAATSIVYWANTGSNIALNITLTGLALPTGSASGTLDTIASSGTYTQTGRAIVFAVAGGAGGGVAQSQYVGGVGGVSGGFAGPTMIQLTGSVSVTIGAGGNSASAGGATTFGSLTANSGGTGAVGGGNASLNVNLNFPNNGNAGGTTGANGAPVISGTTGGGGGGGSWYPGSGSSGGAGGGTGSTNVAIGSGGNGGNGSNTSVGGAGNSGTGYGGGGGGAGMGSNGSGAGGAGRQGVVYVLRFT